MTIPTNLWARSNPLFRGDREDLVDKIWNLSPQEAPVVSSFGRDIAIATFHEWQRDSLGAANADNAIVDGDDVTLDAQVATERVGNYLQIFAKRPGVSRRTNIIKKGGRKTEAAYLKAKAMMEIKRDIEAMVLSNNAAVAALTATAPKSGGLGVQNYLNTSHGGAGATTAWTAGAPTVAVTAGTNRTFTEALLKTMTQTVYNASGFVPPQIVMSASHKGTFSTFTGVGNVNRVNLGKKEQAKIIGGADVYMSDFGAIEVIPHYLMSGFTDVHLINPEYADIVFLDGFATEELGKTGDSQRFLITADCCLAVRSSRAFGKIANLTP